MKFHQTAQTGLIIHSNPTSKDPNSNVIERLRDVLWFSVRIAYNYGKRPRKHLEKSFASTCMLYNHIQTLAINRPISALKFSKHAHTIYLLKALRNLTICLDIVTSLDFLLLSIVIRMPFILVTLQLK